MGKFGFSIPPDFLRTLGKLEDVDRIAPKMINEATPLLENSVKSNLTAHKQSGEMVASIKKTKASRKKDGGYQATVRPTGKDKNGIRNMEKAAYLEFGTSKQHATPWVNSSINDCDSEVLDSMRKTFEREVLK